MRSVDSISWLVKNVHADHGGFAMSQVLRDARAQDEADQLAAARETTPTDPHDAAPDPDEQV